MNETRRVVTIYAASSSQVEQKYLDAAFRLGEMTGRHALILIAKEKWVQKNGGGCTGLMGAATSGGLSAGGIIDAVILDRFVDSNLGEGYRTVKIVSNMAERGLGTLDELTDVMCLRQLSFHKKPIVIVNVNGFYDHFISFLRESINRNFITEAVSRAVLFANSSEEAIGLLKTFEIVEIDKDCLHSGEIAAASKRLP